MRPRKENDQAGMPGHSGTRFEISLDSTDYKTLRSGSQETAQAVQGADHD